MQRLSQVLAPAERPTFGSAGQLMGSPGLASSLGAPSCPGPLQVVTAGQQPSQGRPALWLWSEWTEACSHPLCQHIVGAMPVAADHPSELQEELPGQRGGCHGGGCLEESQGCPGSGGRRWKEDSRPGAPGVSLPPS